jgi:hypothetical protein
MAKKENSCESGSWKGPSDDDVQKYFRRRFAIPIFGDEFLDNILDQRPVANVIKLFTAVSYAFSS